MASVAGYLTVAELIARLGWMNGNSLITISGTTIPNTDTVEDYISEAEEEIERFTRRNWRTAYLTITEEYHSWDYHNQRFTQRGIYYGIIIIELAYQNVIQFDTAEGDKIEVWDGSSWVDLVADYTAGEALRDEDYFLDKKTGRLYIHSNFPNYGKDNIKITYRYGEGAAALPKPIKRCVWQLAGSEIIMTYGSFFQFAIEDSKGGGNYGAISAKYQNKAEQTMEEWKEWKALNNFS